MKIIETKVYEFDELPEDIQQKVLKKEYACNVDHSSWCDGTLEDWTDKLQELGFEDVKILYSGFHSQGDGACFTCERIDFNKYKDGVYRDLDISCKITHSHNYYFASSTRVGVESGDEISLEKHLEIEADIEQMRYDLGNQNYKDLRENYDYLTSKEAIIETIKANEWTFTLEGRMMNG